MLSVRACNEERRRTNETKRIRKGLDMTQDGQIRLRIRGQEDDALYERFAKHLEKDRCGEFVAISRDGKIIVSRDDIEVVHRAMKEFGQGKFAFRRIGHKALGKCRDVH